MRKRRSPLIITIACAMQLTVGADAMAGDPSDPGPDFNDDGYADLAIGVPREDVGSVDDAGAVEIIYGTFDGLNGDLPVDDQFWTQNTSGVQEAAEPNDRFGSALAVGDFNGDGYDDLAIGAPLEDVATAGGEITNAGLVHVLFGSSVGLTATDDELWHQDVSFIEDTVEPGDQFGGALAAADLAGGTADDLVIGVPFEGVNGRTSAGAVAILRGSSSGLSTSFDAFWHQDSSGIPGIAEVSDHFGWSLTTGEFGVTTKIDVAIGSPDEDLGSAVDAGTVTVLYGSTAGPTGTGSRLWTQDSANIAGGVEPRDRFGWALAAGSLGKTSHDDLAIGSPYEDLGGDDEGVVNVIYGSNTGLGATGNQMWHQDSANISGDAEDDDWVGYALAVADFGKGSNDDLAIGAAGETREDFFFDEGLAGAVNIIYGTANGLNAAGQQFWWQDSSGIEGDTEVTDQFGSALSAANFGNGATADLAVGAPGESNEGDSDNFAGAVNVIYSGTSGLASANDQFWWQASSTLHDSSESSDAFGTTLGH